MMMWHSLNKEDVAKALDSQPKKGLTDLNAGLRVSNYGKNIRISSRERSKAAVFMGKLFAPLSMILIVIAVTSAAVNLIDYWSTGRKDMDLFYNLAYAGVLLLAALLLDIVRAHREVSANSTIVDIKHNSLTSVRVRRNAIIKSIPTEDLVPGDIVQIEVGDIIPADGRLLITTSFMCDECALTGDDTPVLKDSNAVLDEETPLEQRVNMAYCGTVAMTGRALMMVTEIGVHTQMALKKGKRPPKVNNRTRIVKDAMEIRSFAVWLELCLMLSVVTLFALQFDVGMLPHSMLEIKRLVADNFAVIPGYLTGTAETPPLRFLFDGMMLFVTLAVCTVPLGLPQNVMHSLARSISRLGREGAMLHRFRKAELIGGASVICTDKSGTLTLNEMTVTKAWPVGDSVSSLQEGFWSDELRYLMKCSTLCCNTRLDYNDIGQEVLYGDQTEAAIVKAYVHDGNNLEELMEQYPRCGEIPFDSSRKLMTVIYDVNGIYVAVTKGAPDVLVTKCIDADVEEIHARNSEFCGEGLRVIAVAVHALNRLPEKLTPEAVETELTFIGLLGLEDPVREDAREAVNACQKAGIRTVMITGDHPETAASLARRLNIMSGNEEVLTGEKLANMSDRRLRAVLSRYSVFARISPEDKVRLIKGWQAMGNCVLMTAGGMNDAPALHTADISCSVEATATDVAVDAADITLSGNHFGNLLELIRQGRRIRHNLRKLTEYSLTCSVAQTAILLLGLLLFGQSLLNLLPLIVLNLLLFLFVQPTFAYEPIEKDAMNKLPELNDGKLVSFFETCRAWLGGFLIVFNTFVAYAIGSGKFSLNYLVGSDRALTMAFAAMAYGLILHAFCTRSNRPLTPAVFFRNWKMLLSVAVTAGLVACMIMLPYVHVLCGLIPLNVREWCEIAALLAVQLVVWEYPKIYAAVKF